MNFISVVAVIIVSISYSSFKDKLQLLSQRRYIIWMTVFFILLILSLFLSSNQKAGFRYLDSRLPLIYFPLSLGLIHLKKDVRDKILLSIAILVTIVVSICLGYGIYRSVTFQNTAFLYNDSLSEPITGQQSIYISLLVNLAIYIFSWFLFYKKQLRYKPLLVLAILFLFIISFLLASRNLMLVLYASTLGFSFYYIIKQEKYLEGATLIMGLLIGVFLVFKFFPKTINRFKELSYTQFQFQQTGPESHYNMAVDTGQWNGANTRLAVWQCGWQLFKQAPLWGVHLGDKKAKLMEVYREKNFQFAIRTEKNLHNNYFDIAVSLGLAGLVLFLVGWILLPIRKAWRHRDGLALLIMLTFAIAMITENYFDRSLGSMLFGFFIPFLLSDKTSKS
ncbi:MAG TPA: O-antigen ligase family protein [Chitinophagaceae bacterium]